MSTCLCDDRAAFVARMERALLRLSGYFPWGYDAWIHESDEGTVLTTSEALAQVLP